MNILITGRPGIGKTTLIKELSNNIGEEAAGFYTEQIRESGRRTGFRIATLDGRTGILSGVNIKSPYRVGKYKVNLEEFESIALPVIDDGLNTSRIIIIDEIGPMELFSQKFKEAVIKALDSPNHLIATIKLKGSKFIQGLKARDDVVLYELTEYDRGALLKDILSKISQFKA